MNFKQKVFNYLYTEESKSQNDEHYTIRFIEGHKDSKGDIAPWCIVKNMNRPGEKVIESFKNKKNAIEHFKEMDYYSKKKRKPAECRKV